MQPYTREEKLYDNILGGNNSIEPYTRKEKYLDEIAHNVGGIPSYDEIVEGVYSESEGEWTQVEDNVLIIANATRTNNGYLRVNLHIKGSENGEDIEFSNCMYNSNDYSTITSQAYLKKGGFYKVNYVSGSNINVKLIKI